MQLSSEALDKLTLKVAREKFSTGVFSRRNLMVAVEKRVSEMGYWASRDDLPSRSSGPKSGGLANIDWSITRLREAGSLLHVDSE